MRSHVIDPVTILPLDEDVYVSVSLSFQYPVRGSSHMMEHRLDLPSMPKTHAAEELVRLALALDASVFAEDPLTREWE